MLNSFGVESSFADTQLAGMSGATASSLTLPAPFNPDVLCLLPNVLSDHRYSRVKQAAPSTSRRRVVSRSAYGVMVTCSDTSSNSTHVVPGLSAITLPDKFL